MVIRNGKIQNARIMTKT